jgi:hypothetical protein
MFFKESYVEKMCLKSCSLTYIQVIFFKTVLQKVMFFKESCVEKMCLKSCSLTYSVVSIKRTGSLNYFEVFYHPDRFFHVLNEFFLPPCSFFHVLNNIFAPPCSLITSCLLNRYYRVCSSYFFQNSHVITHQTDIQE